MFKVILSETHHSLKLTKWGQTQLMILYLLISGTCSLVTVHQPPVIMAALGRAVVLQSNLILSPDEKMSAQPVLYWDHLKGDSDSARLWPSSKSYKSRVALMDSNEDSFNKSILLKNVQWDDSGKYLCKLSITTEGKKFREQGKPTLLMVYDSMIFNITAHDDSLLCCEVKVTRGPAVVLSIFHEGSELETGDCGPEEAAAALPYVTLSKSVHVRGGGNYECQLHLNADLITKSSFQNNPSGVEVFPEPWPLYGSLLLVPITVLLGLIIVQKCRS
ncbi:uncharacterized protein LOC132983636 [Labrus mixtus]|uniref:uncharacterized protein LOC132983636 n=1 Tax=Labrus mixtus TaxID=508554 RepID=UPI0029C01B4C|nr:uncharacterized protein LOC132983636 [Labrus mixtus]